MDYTKMSSGLINKAYNNPINSLTTFAGTHTRGAASPLCPTCLRPLLESYMLFRKLINKEFYESKRYILGASTLHSRFSCNFLYHQIR
jgi:hypothetical protein